MNAPKSKISPWIPLILGFIILIAVGIIALIINFDVNTFFESKYDGYYADMDDDSLIVSRLTEEERREIYLDLARTHSENLSYAEKEIMPPPTEHIDQKEYEELRLKVSKHADSLNQEPFRDLMEEYDIDENELIRIFNEGKRERWY